MRRRNLYSDVAATARAVLAVPPPHRADFCLRLIREAQTADAFMQETGRAHPVWGTGSLMDVARRRELAAERGFDDAAYCQAVRLVLTSLLRSGISRTHS